MGHLHLREQPRNPDLRINFSPSPYSNYPSFTLSTTFSTDLTVIEDRDGLHAQTVNGNESYGLTSFRVEFLPFVHAFSYGTGNSHRDLHHFSSSPHGISMVWHNAQSDLRVVFFYFYSTLQGKLGVKGFIPGSVRGGYLTQRYALEVLKRICLPFFFCTAGATCSPPSFDDRHA